MTEFKTSNVNGDTVSHDWYLKMHKHVVPTDPSTTLKDIIRKLNYCFWKISEISCLSVNFSHASFQVAVCQLHHAENNAGDKYM
jgi:hypothetical protein